jgi:predicted permease
MQVALSALLLVASVLVVRSLQNAVTVRVGLETRHAAAAAFDLSLEGYDRVRARAFEQQLIERVRALPGIDSVGLINGLPLTLAISNCYIYVEGKPPLRDVEAPMAARYWSGPGYLRAAQTKLLAGRDFETRDDADGMPAVLVNETFARQLFPGENPLGKRFRYCGRDGELRQIIGVVEDGKYRSLGESPLPAVFSPLAQFPGLTATVVARSALPETEVAGMLRRVLMDMDPNLPVDAGSMSDQLRLAMLPATVAATALGSFGVLAVVLAATGVYGVMAYAVSRRTREIGIRVALGACPMQVMRLVLRRAVMLISTGTVAGLALALAAGRFFAPILYGISARDPMTYALTILLMAGVAAGACYVPSRRAIKVDPVTALRAE